ncbi:luciferin 4-monooxygenase [Sitophilus oryzae]|uniref:Luciferin 4-monooxygenase n=1 Tax=Sitophilus oryzae TaxID=7048 RepID=A0A6J2XY46_SITOR|nr:luciferin 4-monooxygenase [Sitophilus oryzae]
MSDNKNILQGRPVERVLDVSLGELLLMVMRIHEDNVILVDAVSDEELRARQLLARGIHLAKWFQSLNISIGDSVSITCENRLEFGIVPIGAFLLGVTLAPLNPDYTVAELKHCLGLSKPKIVFCSDKTIDKVISILPEHEYIQKLVLFGGRRHSHPSVVSFNDIVAGVNDIDETFKAVPIDTKETVATILCSSGTTGLPKGVMCTHDNMTTYIDVGRMIMAHLVENDDPSDAIIGLTPFFHSFGFMLMFLNIIRGKKMAVIGKFKLKVFLDTIVKYKVRRVIVPPPVLLIMLKHPLTNKYDLSCIKEIRCGAAALGKEMEKELKQRFKVKSVSQAYGMTETTLGVLTTEEGTEPVLGSVGKVVPGMMAKVINEEGQALGPYQEGELCFKGPLIMKGYVGNPEATAETIDKDHWLHTGDVAYYDKEGNFFIVDRIKELIKYKAFQVAPAELEALLLTHPAIQDCAVIGLPDDEAGELPLAYVVKKPGQQITEEEVKKHVADTLSHQKHLRGGVIFTEEILRNPTGKILRRILREKAKNLVKLKSKL